MTETIFLGGLPRSGSTLLNNMLGQHPMISVGGTSGLSSLVVSIREIYTKRDEFLASDEAEVKDRVMSGISGLISGYSSSNRGYYVDKSRGWVSMISLLREVCPNPKVIIPVRDLRGVFASMEKLYRNNNLNIDPVYIKNVNEGITREARFNTWQSGLPIGTSIGHIKNLIDCNNDQDILFVCMEVLVDEPQSVIDIIYDFIGLPSHKITFPLHNLSKENDRLYAIENLHKTHEDSILPVDKNYEEILGSNICNEILRGYSWFYKRFYPSITLPLGT